MQSKYKQKSESRGLIRAGLVGAVIGGGACWGVVQATAPKDKDLCPTSAVVTIEKDFITCTDRAQSLYGFAVKKTVIDRKTGKRVLAPLP